MIFIILSVSFRTDIVAFYTPWFIKRFHEGFVDVRNPFNPKLISRISFNNVDAILFCTKNPHPIIPYLKEIDKPILFHVTLTGYKNDIEVHVQNKKQIIEDIKKISKVLGKNRVVVRYDPIFLSKKYSVDYHIRSFKRICEELDGFVSRIIISFLDDYKNVSKNKRFLNCLEFSLEDYKKIGIAFSHIAHLHHIMVHTCFEDINLSEYGFDVDDCFSHELAFEMTGKIFPSWKARKEGKCNCVQMVDIGVYNSCRHLCKYCYANYDENKVAIQSSKHNVNSSLLIGEVEIDDIIKERKK